MKNYKVTIRPSTSFITPLDSDTLFGSLCWLIRWNYSEEKLVDFLKSYEDKPQFLISSGVQKDTIPFPITEGIARSKVRQLVEDAFVFVEPEKMNAVIRLIKKIKKEKYLPIDTFKKYVNDFSLERIIKDIVAKNIDEIEGKYQDAFHQPKPFMTSKDRYHNMINRLSNSATDGELFTRTEITYHDDIDVYLRFPEEKLGFWKDNFNALSYEGFGSKKTTGKGQFDVLDFKEVKLPEADNPNHFMTLSSYIPESEIPEGNYKLKTKRGKVGSIYSKANYSPWKKPLIFYDVGSTFEIDENDNDRSYGSLISDIHHSLEDVVQYAYAFDLGVSLSE